MRRRIRTILLTAPLALSCLVALSAQARAAGGVAPLPRSDYGVRAVCGRPTPGRAKCLSMELIPRTAAARAHTHPLGILRTAQAASCKGTKVAAEGCWGLRPQDLNAAYFPGEPAEAPADDPQTIALVDAYDDPQAEEDLRVYSEEFGLPLCTAEKGCFKKVNQLGETTKLPTATTTEEKEAADEWAVEISTDIEIAHAVCQTCHIVLVEADSESYADLEQAEEAAANLGATEISNSWGGEAPAEDSAAFDPAGTAEHPRPVITASAGDSGYLNWTEAQEAEEGEEGDYFIGADYPAASPQVVAVGGTSLTVSQSGDVWQSERVWNDDPLPGGGNDGAGGGGCSTFPAPEWQSKVAGWSLVGCKEMRAVADVAADADPYTGVAVYDTVRDGEGKTPDWLTIGGTSVASPIIASMYALAGGTKGIETATDGTTEEARHPAEVLYSHIGESSLHDITEGGNGECDGDYSRGCSGSLTSPLDCGVGFTICNAHAGYDGPTGVGTPNGIAAFLPVNAKAKEEAEAKAKEEAEAKARQEAKAKEELKTKEEAKAKEELKALEALAAEEAKRKSEDTTAKVGESGTGTQDTNTGSGKGTGESPGSSQTKPSSQKPKPAVELSRLRLLASALEALHTGNPTIAKLRFAFKLSARAKVRVVLYERVDIVGYEHWSAIARTLTIAAVKGTNRGHLQGNHPLPAGSYLLTLTPQHGSSRSIAFQIGKA